MSGNPQSMIKTFVESDSSDEPTDRKPGAKSAVEC